MKLRRPARLIAAAALLFAFSWTIGVPAAALASVAAERCCADHCGTAHTAKMDLDCCRVEHPQDSAPLKAAPSLLPSMVVTPIVAPVAVPSSASVTSAAEIHCHSRPPTYLAQRSLQL